MTLLLRLSAAAFLASALPALAETQVFIVASNPDGYGVDRCLEAGAPCGAAMARTYCKAHQFTQAVSFRRVERREVTASVTTEKSPSCRNGDLCGDLVAIECIR